MRCEGSSRDWILRPSHRLASGGSAQTTHPDRPTAMMASQTCEWALSGSSVGHPAETVDVEETGDDIRRLAANLAEKTSCDTTAHSTSRRTDRSKRWEP